MKGRHVGWLERSLVAGVIFMVSLSTQVQARAVAQSASTSSLGSPVTGMFLDGDAGEAVTGGNAYSFTTVTPGHQGTTLTFAVNQSGHTFNLTLAPATGNTFTLGGYANALATADASHAGINVSGDGTTCTSGAGQFRIDDISLDANGNPVAFSARFDFRCNSETPSVFGAVSYNSTADYRTTTIPAVVNTGTAAPGQSSVQPVTIANNGPSDLTIWDIWLVDPANNFSFTVGSCTYGVVLHAGQSCAIDVTFKPATGTPGVRDATLSLYDDITWAGSGTARTIQLTGTATAVAWPSLGGYITSDPMEVIDPQNPTGVYSFVRGGDNALYWNHSADGLNWSGFQRAGGFLTSLPFAVADPTGAGGTAGAIYVFVRGGDGALYVGTFVAGSWQGFTALGGYFSYFPAATVASNGVWVAVRGGDNALYTKHLTGGVWSAWQDQGGLLSSAPWLAADSSGVRAFVAGGDYATYDRNISAGTPWEDLNGFITAPPVAIADSSGTWLLVRGGQGAVYARHLSNGVWTPYEYIGGYITSIPYPVVDSQGLTMFVRGGEGALYRNHLNGANWSGWQLQQPFTMYSDPIAVADSNSLEHVFAVGSDAALYEYSNNGASGLSVEGTQGNAMPTSQSERLPGNASVYFGAALGG